MLLLHQKYSKSMKILFKLANTNATIDYTQDSFPCTCNNDCRLYAHADMQKIMIITRNTIFTKL